jgi:GT2 family glycosyltransferase
VDSVVTSTEPAVAVVVPTHNRGALLRRTLEALGRVDYGRMSVVVVDDGSRPDHRASNRALAQEAGVAYVEQDAAGPATARNRGVAETRSELVAFLDDDCAPEPDWLRRLVAAFESDETGGLGGVGGRMVSAPTHNWVSGFCAAAEYITGIQPEFINAITANACFRRTVLEEVGGFDEGFRYPGGEDPDLSRRVREAGYEVRFVPDAIVVHAEIDSAREFLRRLFRRGMGEARAKRNEGRVGWVILRAALAPAYCGARASQTWRITEGKAGRPTRLAYACFEALGAAAFVVGSVVGLPRAR